MFKKSLLILISAMYCSISFSQNYSIQIGANHSWLQFKESFINEMNNQKFNPGFSVGGFYNYELNESFSLNSGIRLFSTGMKSAYGEQDFSNEQGDKTTYSAEAVLTHYYIGIPLQFGYNLFEQFVIYINFEPVIQTKTTQYSKYNYKHTSGSMSYENTNETNTNITKDMNRFNLLVGGGIRYFFTIDQMKLGASGQMNFGLFPGAKEEKHYLDSNSYYEYAVWGTREVSLNFELYF